MTFDEWLTQTFLPEDRGMATLKMAWEGGVASVQSAETNPNNCSTCKHKQHPDGGWCYMFRDEPTAVCMIHSLR